MTFDDIDDRGSFLLLPDNRCTLHHACGIFHVFLHEDHMYLHCSNFSLDTAAFTKPVLVDFKVEPLLLLARNRKI